MKKNLAFDIGGTKISYCLINETGNMVSDIVKVATPKSANEIFLLLQRTVKEYENEISGVGIATAGAVNKANTMVLSSTSNLPDGYNKIDFSTLSSKPVFVENDANAAAWAEFRAGSAKGYANSLVITIGTGIGGGIIINNQLLRGTNGMAGEIGSMKIAHTNDRKCTCGQYDCWESYGSGTGLKNTAEELAESDELFKESMFKNKLPKDVTTYDIIQGINAGDKYSQKVYDMWEYHIYCGIVSLVNIFNPEIVIFSGGLGEAINTDKMEQLVNQNAVVSNVKIVKSTMKNDTGMIGVALLAFEKTK